MKSIKERVEINGGTIALSALLEVMEGRVGRVECSRQGLLVGKEKICG